MQLFVNFRKLPNKIPFLVVKAVHLDRFIL